MHRLLLETDKELEILISILEEAVEASHVATVEGDEDAASQAKLEYQFARRFLGRLDPENEILQERTLRAGHAFDWDAFWDSMDDDDGEEEPEATPETEPELQATSGVA